WRSTTRLAAVQFGGGLRIVLAIHAGAAGGALCAVGCTGDDASSSSPAPMTDDAPDAPVGPRAVWAYAGTDTRGAGGRTVRVDANGDVVTLGAFEGRIDFGGGSAHASGTLPHPFVVRHASDGTLKWTFALGSPDWADATDLALDAQGDAYLVGRFSGSIDAVAPPVASLNAHDAFVAKLDRDGHPLWVRHLPRITHRSNVPHP